MSGSRFYFNSWATAGQQAAPGLKGCGRLEIELLGRLWTIAIRLFPPTASEAGLDIPF
jgi:hypothetical protein